MDGAELLEEGLKRTQAGGIDGGGIGAGGVEVAGELGGGTGGLSGPSRELFQDETKLVFVAFGGFEAAAPLAHGGGDGVRGAPGAVRELVEVIAGLDGVVDVAGFDAVQRGLLGRGRQREGDESGGYEAHWVSCCTVRG